MPKKPSQLMELFLTIADRLGYSSDRDVAVLADVGPENVPNWRTGAVKEFKNQKFRAVLHNLETLIAELRERAGQAYRADNTLTQLEVEAGSSPSDLERQFRDRVVYDYLGHRFLYFEPQGALAWENLIKAGYAQERWLSGVEDCADQWLDVDREMGGRAKGEIARRLGLNRRDRPRGLDIISLGPGEGGKELLILEHLLRSERESKMRAAWLNFAPVDVSIALLMAAAQSSRGLLLGPSTDDDQATSYRSVMPFIADFEEGRLSFLERLKTSTEAGADGLRLVLILGNILGNLRDEETFVRQKLWRIARPGDLVWLEVGLRADKVSDDALFRLTQDDDGRETAADANRRILLEGPYRRWASAIGRPQPRLKLRVWAREDDEASRIPGSYNFCHDLLIEDESRVCTMLYSRRYDLDQLCRWFEELDFDVVEARTVEAGKGKPTVAHLLVARRQ
jgi:hypothetical protein